MYKFLFGPAPSRRPVVSPGIDLVPYKICTLNCVYCKCGPSTKLTRKRKEYISIQDVKNEITRYL